MRVIYSRKYHKLWLFQTAASCFLCFGSVSSLRSCTAPRVVRGLTPLKGGSEREPVAGSASPAPTAPAPAPPCGFAGWVSGQRRPVHRPSAVLLSANMLTVPPWTVSSRLPAPLRLCSGCVTRGRSGAADRGQWASFREKRADRSVGAETHLRPETVDVCFLSSAPHAVCTRHAHRAAFRDRRSHLAFFICKTSLIDPEPAQTGTRHPNLLRTSVNTQRPGAVSVLINNMLRDVNLRALGKFLNASCAHGLGPGVVAHRERRGRARTAVLCLR